MDGPKSSSDFIKSSSPPIVLYISRFRLFELDERPRDASLEESRSCNLCEWVAI